MRAFAGHAGTSWRSAANETDHPSICAWSLVCKLPFGTIYVRITVFRGPRCKKVAFAAQQIFFQGAGKPPKHRQ